ncbi:transglycosylase domain-containing protein [Microbacteriaceae bacterium 4G12]
MKRIKERIKQWYSVWKQQRLRVKLLASALLVVLFIWIGINIMISTQDIRALEKAIPQPTIIYDQEGHVAAKISSSQIEGVRLKDISLAMREAVVAVEDKQFYEHHGIDYSGITHAFIKNITAGGVVAGGSTITQQLAKNVFLGQERTFSRKVKEYFLTKKIERTYTKDEILEMYLNQIYFGEGAWGINKAAQTYFGKSAAQLTNSEAATLAGLIKAPSNYSPFKNMDRAMQRRNIVLSLMKQQHYLTEKQYEQALKEGIVLQGKKEESYSGKYPYYVDYIVREAMQSYHLTQNEILSGGYHIYTELMPTMQEATEKVYKDDRNFPTSAADQQLQSAAVLVNPKTGGIVALVGGRGDYQFLGFNHASQLKRQPGSTLKPLSVYTPALEQGYEVYSMLKDEPLRIGEYEPKNFGGEYHGEVTMYEALAKSYNVPAVWLLQNIGLDKGVDALQRFGIPLTKQDTGYSLALGGMSEGTSPVVMAEAYATFANDGTRIQAHAIQKIETKEGELVGQWYNKAMHVTDKKTAQKVTYLLQGAVEEGTGKQAKLSKVDTAGKTGTTQLPNGPSDGAKDVWFVGYTPELVGAVWLGYDKTDSTHYVSASSAVPAKIFREITTPSLQDTKARKFDLSAIPSEEYTKKLQQIEKNQKQEEKKKIEKEEKEKKKKKWEKWFPFLKKE